MKERQLIGEWHNAQGETIKITEDGKFYGNTLQGEESGIILRSVTSDFFAYQSYQVGAFGFYYVPNQDAIILYSHSEYMPQPGHQLYYNRVVSRENTSPSSSVQDIKKVPAKPFSGPNPYKADLIKSIRFSTRNGEVTPTYYALYDVDDNGTAELLLGHDNEGEPSVLGVYVMISGKPEQVIAIQDNMVVTIYQNGHLSTGGRAGIGELWVTVYALRRDNSGVDNIKETSFQVGSEVGRQLVASDEVTGFDWKRIADVDKQLTETKSTTPSSSSKESSHSEAISSDSARQEKQVVKDEGNLIQKLYQVLTLRQNLPSTGESVSGLAMIGLILTAVGMAIKKSRKP